MIPPDELRRRKAAEPDALAYFDAELGAVCGLCAWESDVAPLEVLEARVAGHLATVHGVQAVARVNDLGQKVTIPTVAPSDELGEFKAGSALCLACGHRWVAVADVEDGAPALECPSCSRPAGRFVKGGP